MGQLTARQKVDGCLWRNPFDEDAWPNKGNPTTDYISKPASVLEGLFRPIILRPVKPTRDSLYYSPNVPMKNIVVVAAGKLFQGVARDNLATARDYLERNPIMLVTKEAGGIPWYFQKSNGGNQCSGEVMCRKVEIVFDAGLPGSNPDFESDNTIFVVPERAENNQESMIPEGKYLEIFGSVDDSGLWVVLLSNKETLDPQNAKKLWECIFRTFPKGISVISAASWGEY
jgi:hypothetical protein